MKLLKEPDTESSGRDHRTIEVPNPVDRTKTERELRQGRPPPPPLTILLDDRV